jgi:DNA mismatch endonuclease (patch repair protein)
MQLSPKRRPHPTSLFNKSADINSINYQAKLEIDRMTDNLTKKQRSRTMSRIRSKWTLPERKIHNILKGRKIKHIMHPKIDGSPDILIPDKKIAIFIHGCFWHKCPKHYKEPSSERDYWLEKIEKNVKRDIESVKKLRSDGWKVRIIWEHEIRDNAEKCLSEFTSS